MASLSALPFDYQVQTLQLVACWAPTKPPVHPYDADLEPVPYGLLQAAKARVTRAAEAALPVQVKRFLATTSFDALALAFAQHAAARFEAAALAEVCCQTSPPAPLHHSSTAYVRAPLSALPDHYILLAS